MHSRNGSNCIESDQMMYVVSMFHDRFHAWTDGQSVWKAHPHESLNQSDTSPTIPELLTEGFKCKENNFLHNIKLRVVH